MTPKQAREFAKRFDQVYLTHQRSIHAYFYARTDDIALAEDFMQEVFARAWARFHDLAALDADQQRNWLFAIARNLLVRELRRKRIRSKRSLAAWFDLRVPDNSSPLWAMASERQRASHALKRSFTSSAWSLHHSQSL